MSFRKQLLFLLCLGLVAACRGSVTERSVLDDAARRLIYDRADRVFETAVLLTPTAEEQGRALDLAPLLLQEVEPGAPLDPTRVVYLYSGTVEILGERHEQRTYLWELPAAGDAEASSAQGVRMTLGRDGFPAIYEVLTDSSGARLIFVTATLEGAAVGEFGDPLAGRSFAIERAVEETPDVVVAGILEPGPIPLGPFLYLTRESSDIAAVICRCMESRVETVAENLGYELRPIDDLDLSGLALPPWLRTTEPAVQRLRLPDQALLTNEVD